MAEYLFPTTRRRWMVETKTIAARDVLAETSGFPDWPRWWRNSNSHMKVLESERDGRLGICGRLKLGSSTATVIITPDVLKRGWVVNWETQCPDSSSVYGRVLMSPDALRVAFGVCDADPDCQSQIDEAGVVCAEQPGKFCRLGPYLSIPCLGTGCEGDPNVSILLDDAIREEVAYLLKQEGL